MTLSENRVNRQKLFSICTASILAAALSCQQPATPATNGPPNQSTMCEPGEDCSDPTPPFLAPDGTGGGEDPVCILSPVGVFPLPTPTQGWHPSGYDFAGTTIYAPIDGLVRPDGGTWGSRDCYRAGACYGGTNCPCAKDEMGNYQLMCVSGKNPHYTLNGTPDYAIGNVCQRNTCDADNCANPYLPCANRLGLEFKANKSVYLFRVLHIEKLLVNPGTNGVYVKAGDPIAIIGNTGFSCTQYTTGTGNHGHLELRKWDDVKRLYNPIEGWPGWVAKTCAPILTCGSGKLDGTETDIDCGGGACPTCVNGKRCSVNGDCQSGLCSGNVCQTASTCTDGIQNGNETDIDCGGGCPVCADGKQCRNDTDCNNSTCNGTRCITTAQILVDNLTDPPIDLAIDSAFVYWVENRATGAALRKVAKSGGTVTTLSTSLAEPTAVIVDASYAYVLERNGGSNGMIHRVPINGGASELVVSGLNNSQSRLAQSGNNIYWADYVIGTGGVIKTAPKGANATASILAQGNGLLNMPSTFDTDSTYLYVPNASDNILRFPLAGGSPITLGSAKAGVMRVLGSAVYFANCTDKTIGSMPITGGAASTVTIGGSNCIGDLAVDSSYVYSIDYSTPGSVRQSSIGAGQLKSYWPNGGGIGIEVDGKRVFWTTYYLANQGRVVRAAK